MSETKKVTVYLIKHYYDSTNRITVSKLNGKLVTWDDVDLNGLPYRSLLHLQDGWILKPKSTGTIVDYSDQVKHDVGNNFRLIFTLDANKIKKFKLVLLKHAFDETITKLQSVTKLATKYTRDARKLLKRIQA